MRSVPGFALSALALLLATSRSDAAIDALVDEASVVCTTQVLQELGWQLEYGDHADPIVHTGQPCDRATLADAWRAGDLRVALPTAGKASESSTFLRELLSDPGSHCAYSFRVGDATRRAVDRLVDNRGFRFSGLQLGWIGFGVGGAERDGWTPIRSFGRGFEPAVAPSHAIEGFYHGRIRAECGVGRQIAQYAAQYELHGADGFDRSFAPDEIVVGTFRQLQDSRSVLLGETAGEFIRDGRARATSAQGRQAFAGLPGFIFHVFGPDSLDDADNQAENFVVYEVSASAAEALRSAGGFEAFNRKARTLWELSRPLGLVSRRSYERLLFERDSALRARLPPRKLRVIEQMDAILDDPFFQEFRIYVHPKGVKPVAYHFARLLDLNPRTPFRIELGLHNVHTTLYQRWIRQRLDACDTNGAEEHRRVDGVDTSPHRH